MNKIDSIIQSGNLSMFRGTPDGQWGGEYVQLLEMEFEDKLHVNHAIAVNSATAGLHIALSALGIGQGDEVIVSPYSFSSSASCVLMVGAKPVFVDIVFDTYSIASYTVDLAITERTKAIIPVHLFGHPADMGMIMELAEWYNLRVIEDAAQSIMAQYGHSFVGTIGDCGVFSFNQSKHINTGEGGMVVTNSAELAYKLRALRNHAEVSAPELKMVGYNYRLGEIEAYLALEQFKGLEQEIITRMVVTDYLTTELCDIVATAVIMPECSHVWWSYPIRIHTGNRDAILKALQDEGIACDKYVEPLYNLPIYKQFGYQKGMCPVAERLWESEMLRLTVKDLTFAECDRIISIIKSYVKS